MRPGIVSAVAVVSIGLASPQMPDLSGSFTFPLEGNAIGYAAPAKRDPIAALQRKIDNGEVKLAFDEKHGYLQAVLDALHVPLETQMLVFSKTSFQFGRISPATPRSLYFNDDVYIGWVQNGEVVEVSSVDPERGAIFYTLDQRPVDKPKFDRRDECLQCHASPRTLGVPGHLVRSVYSDNEGFPQTQAGGFVTDHRSPFEERWGGWYVTGTHGAARHMGNVVVEDKNHPDRLDPEAGANLESLDQLVDVSPYLTPHSDIVALMLLEHQSRMHNLITRVSFETKVALRTQDEMNKALGRPKGEWSDSTKRRIHSPSEVLLRYMLFVEEPELKAPVKGTSGLEEMFADAGPRDSKGRSLRDLDLRRKTFVYPCSYLIYSDAFDSLPSDARNYILRRLWEVLSGKENGPDFKTLTASDRRAILEILRETKKSLPAYWFSE